MPTTDPFEPAKQVLQLAHVADQAAADIFNFIVKFPSDPDVVLWRRLMRDLDGAAADLEAQALQIMGAINDNARAALKSATAIAEAFTKETEDIKKALKVFASVLNLAGALLSGAGVLAVVDAATAVKNAAKGEDEKAKAGAGAAATAGKKPGSSAKKPTK